MTDAKARLLQMIADEPHMGGGGLLKAVTKAQKVAKKTKAAAKVIEAPSVIIPGRLSDLKEVVRGEMGNYGAKRVERAADEIPNLERMYREEALRQAFTGDNAKGLMTLDPADFEKYATPLMPREKPWPGSGPKKENLPTDEYVNYLAGLNEYHDVPFLEINKQEQGLPLVPFISGHEGRHRNRAMAQRGEQAGLVQLLPRSELREPLPRRSQEEYIQALRDELEMTGNIVLPQPSLYPSDAPKRPAVRMPDIYAEGGAVHMAGGGRTPKYPWERYPQPKKVPEMRARQINPVAGAVKKGADYATQLIDKGPSFSSLVGNLVGAIPFVGPDFRKRMEESEISIPTDITLGSNMPAEDYEYGQPMQYKKPGITTTSVPTKDVLEALKVSDLVGTPGLSKVAEDIGYGQMPDALDLLDAAGVAALGYGAVKGGVKGAKAAQQGALSAAKAAERFAEKKVPEVMERGGLGAEMLGAMGNRTISSLDVYHGSPHKFDKFDSAKIGTGEDAQAYGHGLYLAENPRVADEYASKLSKPFVDFTNTQPSNELEKALKKQYEELAGRTQASHRAQAVYELWVQHANPVSDFLYGNAYQKIPPMNPEQLATRLAIRDAAKKLGPPISGDSGSLYKVDLPDEKIAQMLDYDKHMSEQSPEVQKILLPYQKEIGSSFGTGEQTLKAIAFERRMQGLDDSPAAVAQQLKEMGIPGVKYLDEGSRNLANTYIVRHPQGGENVFSSRASAEAYVKKYPEDKLELIEPKVTRNFVTFPGEEKSMTILERNGQPMSAPAAPEGMAEGGEVKSFFEEKSAKQRLLDMIAEEPHMAGGGVLKAVAKAQKTAKAVKAAESALKVKPPSDNILNVRQANFQYPKTVGNQTVSIDKLSGGVRMTSASEKQRVNDLASKISSPEGYISRLIVDQNNNVIEGQHRLEALRQLGIKDVPVYKIEELADTMPVSKMESAVKSVGSIHSDHVGQLVSHALEHIAEGGIDNARKMNYGKFQKHYDAALDAAVGMQQTLPAAERDANLAKMLAESKIPQRLYHGTGDDIKEFRNSRIGAMGPGTYLAESPKNASGYSTITNRKGSANQPNVMPVYAQIKNPFVISDVNKSSEELFKYFDPEGKLTDDEVIKKVMDAGYDAIYAKSTGEINVLDPKKIKSAIGNSGTYDTTDPDINKAKGGEVHMVFGGLTKARKVAKAAEAAKKAAKAAKAAAKTVERVAAPQDEALRLAQKRAALPTSKGGLGLPANNTPAQRAAAMGFTKDKYHGSLHNIKKFDVNKASTESYAGKGVYSTDSPEDASLNYASIYGPDVDAKINRVMDESDRDWRRTYGRLKDETLTPRQQEILLRETLSADNLGVVYPLKVRSDKPVHLEPGEERPLMVGPFERYDEATDQYMDTPQTDTFQRALDEFSDLGGETNRIREFVADYGDEDGVFARDLFNAVQKQGSSDYLIDPYSGELVSSGVAAGDFLKHFGVDEISHAPQFRSPQLNIGKEHTISFDPENVRSRFAAFDPFRRNAAIAAAMGVAAPDLLAKEQKKAGGGEVHMGLGGVALKAQKAAKAAKAAKVDHPLVFPRAAAKTINDIRPIAQRMADQMTGNFVKQNPKVITNPAGKSRKQFERERNMPLETRNLVPERPAPDLNYENYKGYGLVGVPGDPTLGGVVKRGSLEQLTQPTVELTRVGDITPDYPVPLFGGPRYGDDEKFWASGLIAAVPIQNNVTELAKLYEAPVLGKYIKMGESSENFALHNLDALLSIQRPEKLNKAKMAQLTELIQAGSPKYGKFPGFTGFKDPADVLLQAQMDSKLRKHIAETLRKPTITDQLGLPNGLDVVAAITHPELRNLETGASGFSVGKMSPKSNLRQFQSSHPSYNTDIPGSFLGRSRYPTPYEIAFPDTTAYARSQMTPGVQEFNMMKRLGPRERIDQQYIDEIKMYEQLMKQYTGKKKGGLAHSKKVKRHGNTVSN